jgi:dCMP deaminase
MGRSYKQKEIKLYIDMAQRVAEQSYAVRSKVGSVFVATSGVLSIGYNGTPAGWDNCCEDKIYSTGPNEGVPILYGENNPIFGDGIAKSTEYPYKEDSENGLFKRYKLVTKACVSHAEENLLAKLLREGVTSNGGDIFQTLEPCMPCAKQINSAGINAIYFRDAYRLHDGVDFLKETKVKVYQVSADGEIINEW